MKWLVIILTAMFTGAKLAKAISWSWWLVFSPAIIYWGNWCGNSSTSVDCNYYLLVGRILSISYQEKGTEKCKFKA